MSFSNAVILLAITLSFITFTHGSEKAGRCLKYRKDEERFTIIGGERHCLEEGDFTYCREWTCHPKCSNFEKWSGVCEACEGMCTDGGRLYNEGDDFKCVDNANNCRCLKNGKISSTRKNASVKEMCFDELREAKKP